MNTDFDVLIIGAGISGIGAACHLATRLPHQRVAILEGRKALGGTWDLFRYPGVRSDSDLHTFGYEFKPWTSPNMIADADEILDYLREAAAEHGVLDTIRTDHRVEQADWDSAAARWTVRARHAGEDVELTCRWLFSATGYYDYAEGYRPTFPGEDAFTGQLVHPQAWPEDLDHAGKRIVVIGSGATAMTIVPAMAETADHVTMLQRSPGYVLPVPRRNRLANGLQRVLPGRLGHALVRRMNIAVWQGVYRTCQAHPRGVRRLIRAVTKLQLPKDHPVDVHFKPRYDPWDERLCAVPDGDLFRALRRGRASVVTDHIARFTERGVLLASGRELEADVIVTATGLKMQPLGGVRLSVDARPVDLTESVAFKGMMLSGVPNFAYALGYTNISWTLKVDLVCEHLCRLIDHVDRAGYDQVVPELDDPAVEKLPLLDFQAGYVQRGVGAFWRRGSQGPWTAEMDYGIDRARLRRGAVQDPALRFATAADAAAAPAPLTAVAS